MSSVGGLARRASYLDEVRRAEPNTLVVDTGGTLGGKSVADGLMARALVAMRYDVVNLGATELKADQSDLRLLGSDGGPALVASNSHVSVDVQTKPYVVREVNGLRVGFVGVTAADAGGTDPVQALRSLIPEVRRQTDLVVVLADLPSDDARALARADLGIQVVLGARSLAGAAPTREGDTIYSSAGGDGVYVDRLTLTIGPGGRVEAFDGAEKTLDPAVPDDAGILALRSQYP